MEQGPSAEPESVVVLIPALDEAVALPHVLADIPRELPAPYVLREIIVVDNGSSDGTADVAREAGARVVVEPRRGYGSACLAGLASLRAQPPRVVVFLDGDRSDVPAEMTSLLEALRSAELVIGSRTLGRRERGSLTPQQRVGNRIAGWALSVLYGVRTTDLGPFRCLRWSTLERLGMMDRDYGWTVEMQIKAAKHGLRTVEVPVSYRRRIGVSKVSGTLRGSLGASRKILGLLARHALG